MHTNSIFDGRVYNTFCRCSKWHRKRQSLYFDIIDTNVYANFVLVVFVITVASNDCTPMLSGENFHTKESFCVWIFLLQWNHLHSFSQRTDAYIKLCHRCWHAYVQCVAVRSKSHVDHIIPNLLATRKLWKQTCPVGK